MADIRFKGFDEYIAVLRNAPQTVRKDADFFLMDAANTWEEFAKKSAPKDQGKLAGGIVTKPTKGGYDVVVNSEYAPYQEWGTKTRVRVPSELQQYASQFKGKKGGGQAKRAIFDWCKRVGIPPERWFLVYRSIMRYGVHPHPFFFIHKQKVEAQLLADLQQLVESL